MKSRLILKTLFVGLFVVACFAAYLWYQQIKIDNEFARSRERFLSSGFAVKGIHF